MRFQIATASPLESTAICGSSASLASPESSIGFDQGPVAGWVAASITELPVLWLLRSQTASALPLASTATRGISASWAPLVSSIGFDQGPAAVWVAASTTRVLVFGLTRSQTAT